MNDETLSRDTFRQAMSKLPASVNVITTDGDAGRWGMTASAVCSVSDQPPSLLVCINQATRLYELAMKNRVLAVNVLKNDQKEISALFAGGDVARRFATGNWQSLRTGAPLLLDALVSFDCRVSQVVPSGTHGIFIAEVVAAHVADAGGGLVYFDRAYRPLDEMAA
ncbi:MAG TPA: flavin reductase family protein [Paracoccus sp. (in: a-proteobacteria)]|uniref:flavin reductase family protein n=1 Tax=Paracoccus sp. TaxID=267 RepID=UPI002CEDEC4A|nr:flavin reductase family protein [Paracoccus sp. (in: a-proteobacteria)]HWL58879.1 flavin reductase family protein [Paracoccus sp. (in: a-proteobacteria)]